MNIERHGGVLHYDVVGEGEPTVVLVHGFPLTQQMWDPVLDPLQQKNRVVLLNLPGFGESATREKATIAEFADDIAAILDEAGIDTPVVVVGLSMGGYVALEFALRHADRLAGLVLVSTRAEADTPERVRDRMEHVKRAQQEGVEAIVRPLGAKLFSATTPEGVKESWMQMMMRSRVDGVVAALHAMASRADLSRELSRIAVPTLIVAGKDDVVTPADEMRAMGREIKGSHLEVVEQAGHLVPIEQPVEFARIMRVFLDEVASLTA